MTARSGQVWNLLKALSTLGSNFWNSLCNQYLKKMHFIVLSTPENIIMTYHNTVTKESKFSNLKEDLVHSKDGLMASSLI